MKKSGIWIILIGLIGLAAQLAFTTALWDRLTFEGIAESIRNPYWVSRGELYDGISSNVIYYKILDLYYRVSGFHLFAAKEFRFLLSCFSICAIGFTLYFSRKFRVSAGIAFLAWVLSPTLLFFATHQASFGIDLQVFPVIGAIWVFSIQSRGINSHVRLFIAVFLTMLLAAAFPPGLFYLPAIILTDLLVCLLSSGPLRNSIKKSMKRSATIIAALVAGLIVPFLIVDNFRLLIHDPDTGAGLFRGGGKLSLNPLAFLGSVWRSVLDLFKEGASYEFYLPHPEFGTVLGIAVFAVMLFLFFRTAILLRKLGRQNLHELIGQANFRVTFFAIILLATFLVMSHLSPNLPGLRRSAGLLVAFYLLFYLAIEACLNRSFFNNDHVRRFLLIILSLLPVSHAIQGMRNLADLPAHSRESYPEWLKTHPTAAESLSVLYSEVKAGRSLTCAEVPAGCRYSAPFASLQLFHRSEQTGPDELPVYAEDPRTGATIRVELSLWRDYYWIH